MVRNLRSMLAISYAGCPDLSLVISAQFTFEMWVNCMTVYVGLF